jgi:uncharacterized protein DUF3551
MPNLIRLLLLVGAALVGEAQALYAQSAPSSYPWCAVSPGRGGGGRSCYYTSQQQCMDTMSGVGGYCIQNPAYRGQAARSRSRRNQ